MGPPGNEANGQWAAAWVVRVVRLVYASYQNWEAAHAYY